MSDGLTPAQERFCAEYLLDLNATRAYQAAYPKATAKSARTAGPRLLANVGVSSRVAELQAERAKRVQLDADRVLLELKEVVLSSVEHYAVSETGIALAAGAPAAAMRAVSSVKVKTEVYGKDDNEREVTTVEYRLWDKVAAIRLAMQHLGMLTETVELKLPPDQAASELAALLDIARRRASATATAATASRN